MPLFLKALDPDIDIFGNRQSFHFNHEDIPDDNKGFYSLVNHFTPTASTKLESSLDLLDKNLSGFRLFHEQSLGQTYGSLALQSHSVFGTSEDIFKYDEETDKFTFYKDVEFSGNSIISNTGKFDYISSTASPQFVVFLSPIGMNNLPITNMGSPSNDYDAANKIYVDSKIYNINSNTTGQLSINRLQNYPASSSVYLRGDGSWTTPSANINLPYNLYTSATNNTSFNIYNSNNSAYSTGFSVYNQNTNNGIEFGLNSSTAEGYVWATSTMSLKFGTNATTRMKINSDGSVNMYANRITNLGYPSASSDAATKSYVDSVVGGGGSGSTSILHGYVGSGYTSNISSGDHLKFSAVSFSRGSSISLDTSSSYTTSSGIASIGRITLQAGKTYKLVGSINNISSSSYNATRWYNSDNNTPLGVNSGSSAPNSSIDRVPSATTIAYITTVTTTRVELRSTWNSFSQVRGTDDAIGPAWFTVEEV